MTLLLLTVPLWMIAWLSVDMLLYLGYKIVRRDFIYFMALNGAMKYAASLVVRIVAKVLTDFTGLLLLRGPYGKKLFV